MDLTFPRSWLCRRQLQCPALDEKGNQVTHRAQAEGVMNVQNRMPAPARPVMRFHFEGEVVQFDAPLQLPRTEGPVHVMDPKSGMPRYVERSDGTHDYEWVLSDELDEFRRRKMWLRDEGVTAFVPLTDEEAQRLMQSSKTKGLESLGKLHYEREENILAWMRPYSEWAAHGLTPPADYREPEQPEADGADQVKSLQDTLNATVSALRSLEKRQEASDKRAAAAELENTKLRKGLKAQNAAE